MALPRQNRNRPKSAGGRPRKFSGSSRPVTVTLPDETLERLATINDDRAKAIVKAVDWAVADSDRRSPVELIEVADNQAIIVVGPSKLLRKISFLKLIEIAPKRFLLVLPTGTAVEALEVAVLDALNSLNGAKNHEARLLTDLQRCLAKQRRGQRMSKAELLLIDCTDGTAN